MFTKDYSKWHRWFAWYPVPLSWEGKLTGKWAYMDIVFRRLVDMKWVYEKGQ